jgi:hypothetical protein
MNVIHLKLSKINNNRDVFITNNKKWTTLRIRKFCRITLKLLVPSKTKEGLFNQIKCNFKNYNRTKSYQPILNSCIDSMKSSMKKKKCLSTSTLATFSQLMKTKNMMWGAYLAYSSQLKRKKRNKIWYKLNKKLTQELILHLIALKRRYNKLRNKSNLILIRI